MGERERGGDEEEGGREINRERERRGGGGRGQRDLRERVERDWIEEWKDTEQVREQKGFQARDRG